MLLLSVRAFKAMSLVRVFEKRGMFHHHCSFIILSGTEGNELKFSEFLFFLEGVKIIV